MRTRWRISLIQPRPRRSKVPIATSPAIGLGYADSALQTIYPQPHDIPMNLIVTDQSICDTAAR
jgi:5-formyltetrahydrofolate cyclo-ligase